MKLAMYQALDLKCSPKIVDHLAWWIFVEQQIALKPLTSQKEWNCLEGF